MSALQVDADSLFRAVTSHEYKVMAYYLDLRNGEITSRTLNPDEVQEPPPGPSVKPLPMLGGDLESKGKDAPGAFWDAPVEKKKDLFGEEQKPSKDPFGGDFWKKEDSGPKDPFGGGPYKRASGAKKIAELFGDAPPSSKPSDPFKESKKSEALEKSKPAPEPVAQPSAPIEIDPDQPLQRIPPATEAQVMEWHAIFARECGDPQIRELLEGMLRKNKPMAAFERALRKYQRMEQQWRNYFRKQALHYAAEWLKLLPVQWTIVDETRP